MAILTFSTAWTPTPGPWSSIFSWGYINIIFMHLVHLPLLWIDKKKTFHYMIILDAPYGLTLIQGPSISQYRYKKDSWTSQSCIYFCSQKYLLKECKMFLYLRHFHHMSILARSWTTNPGTMNFTILVKGSLDIIAMQFCSYIYWIKKKVDFWD